MHAVILQLFNQGKWWDAAELSFANDKMSGLVTLSYLPEYIITILSYNIKDCWACSVNAPVSMEPIEYPNWPALLDDLLPVGKSRQWWLQYLNHSRSNEFQQNYTLLTHACMAPVGNLRIKESVETVVNNDVTLFPVKDVIELQYNFLEYANEHGAAVGGATGVAGVAPKLLLMLAGDKVYIDGNFAGKPLHASPYLTKFARNSSSERDNNILRAEGVFYQALTQILSGMNIKTIDVSKMKLFEHEGQVSLWLPRFDIQFDGDMAIRIGLESIYSIINAEPGSYQNHFQVMETVWEKIKDTTTMTSTDFAKQYLTRDLLNLIFGNTDNHGRNISFLKYHGDIQFAPIYDFAPMKADPEIVTRLFKWERNCEKAGHVNFTLVLDELSEFCDKCELKNHLFFLAKKLINVYEVLEELSCPEEILNFPAIGFNSANDRLIKMGLINE